MCCCCFSITFPFFWCNSNQRSKEERGKKKIIVLSRLYFVTSCDNPNTAQILMPWSWKPAWKTGKMMVSWCLSQKLMRRRDVEMMCGVLYPCWGTRFITSEMFHLLGITLCCLIFPFSDLSLAAEEEWLSCCLFDLSCCWPMSFIRIWLSHFL